MTFLFIFFSVCVRSILLHTKKRHDFCVYACIRAYHKAVRKRCRLFCVLTCGQTLGIRIFYLVYQTMLRAAAAATKSKYTFCRGKNGFDFFFILFKKSVFGTEISKCFFFMFVRYICVCANIATLNAKCMCVFMVENIDSVNLK